jgi:DNA-binding transcriptional MerR regulator
MSLVLGASEATSVTLQAEGAVFLPCWWGPMDRRWEREVGKCSKTQPDLKQKDKIGLNEMNNVATKMVVIPDIAGPAQDVAEEDRALAISEMSERFDVTLRTLRFYEEKGLLNPVRRGARRFYGTRDVSRMRVILQAKKIGLTLAEIRRVIKLVESGTRRDEQYKELQEICRAQQEILVEQKQMLDEQIAEVGEILSTFERLID